MTIPMTVQDLIDELKKHDLMTPVTFIDYATETLGHVVGIHEIDEEDQYRSIDYPAIAIVIDY